MAYLLGYVWPYEEALFYVDHFVMLHQLSRSVGWEELTDLISLFRTCEILFLSTESSFVLDQHLVSTFHSSPSSLQCGVQWG